MTPLPNQHWTKQIKQVHKALEAWQELTTLTDSYFITSEGNIFAKLGSSVIVHPSEIEETGTEPYMMRSKRIFYSRRVNTPKEEESVLYRLKIAHEDIESLEKLAFWQHQELHSEVLPLQTMEDALDNIVCLGGWSDMEKLNRLLKEQEEVEQEAKLLEERKDTEQLLPDDFDLPSWGKIKKYSANDVKRNQEYLKSKEHAPNPTNPKENH